MKTLAIILAVTAGVGYNSTATAADFPVMGQTLSMGVTSDSYYTTGVADWAWTATPYTGLSVNGVNFLVETDIDMLKLDEGSVFTGLDFSAGYVVPSTNVNLYTEVSSDKDFDFGNVKLGAKVKW